MSVIARRVASGPARSSTETWDHIVALLASEGSHAHRQLKSATNVAAMLVAEEYSSNSPIVAIPTSGPRVRVYTVHGERALETLEQESSLPERPLGSDLDWTLSLPCDSTEIAEFQSLFASFPNIDVRDLDEDVEQAGRGGETASSKPRINLEEMRKT